ncbi:MAG: hypothetical protein V1733_11335 [bacterium]
MELKVYTRIDDPELVIGWKSFEEEAEIFPQSRYSWANCWWKHMWSKQSLYTIAVKNDVVGRLYSFAANKCKAEYPGPAPEAGDFREGNIQMH